MEASERNDIAPLPEGLAEVEAALEMQAVKAAHERCTHDACGERRAARAALSALRDYAARVEDAGLLPETPARAARNSAVREVVLNPSILDDLRAAAVPQEETNAD